MPSSSHPTSSEPKLEVPQSAPQPACPVCSGLLITLRGLFRCTRCGYSLCCGCEGGGPDFPDLAW
jgi:hypothetical protein